MSLPPPLPKPGKIQALAIVTLVSGCINALSTLIYLLYTVLAGLATMGLGCLIIVLPALLGTTAVLEIIYATKILATPMKTNRPNKAVAILEICCILACNPIPLAAGIIALVFYGDPDVINYFNAMGAIPLNPAFPISPPQPPAV